MNNYAKAYVEVLEILKYIPENDLKKIPSKIIDTLKKNADKGYVYKVNKELPFEKQNLMEETKDILAVLFRDYWATDYQRQQIILHEKAEIVEEEKNKIKINYDEVFKKNKKETVLPVKKENKKWYEKFLEFIKAIFKREKKN